MFEIAIRFQMFPIYVRNDGDLRFQLQERPVTLIRLRHEIFADRKSVV